MSLRQLSYETKIEMLKSLGQMYRKEQTKSRISNHNDMHEYSPSYVQQGIEYMIEEIMQNCSKDTACIIKHDFLMQSPRNWYYNYYAKSSYYRLRKEAVEEFVRCLDI
ncbi:MAG: hypothetical protein MR283_02100 [Erysipelotrichaceae bacterium]|nr:hypothetical protein [Erysipelotrichaceae bacterium]MDY6035590.1 hypothetical protein [Bulleidia sp.]